MSEIRSCDPMVTEELAKINFTMEYSPNTYAEEVKTTNYTSSIFNKGIKAAENAWAGIVEKVNDYVDHMYVDAPEYITYTEGTTDKTDVNIRTDAGTDNATVGLHLNQNELFEVGETKKDKDGIDWVKITRKDGTSGYVRADLITILGDKTIEKTNENKIGTVQTPQDKKLNVRSYPKSGESVDNVIKMIDNGEKVEIIETEPNGFIKVKISDGTIGYVVSEYVKEV